MLDVDQELAEPLSQTLQDFIDGNRSVHDVIEEVIEETNELTIEDFLSEPDKLFEWNASRVEVQLRLMNLLAEIQKSSQRSI